MLIDIDTNTYIKIIRALQNMSTLLLYRTLIYRTLIYIDTDIYT